jgi:hypothetical protein
MGQPMFVTAARITARAGQQASGLTALTVFIQALSSYTIHLAQHVNVVEVKCLCALQSVRDMPINSSFVYRH